ncbi:MAG TPA: tetratricopeptide repeat protein, partial [Chloroflexota bacterium]|nr:tetratricopeptide repeat protein [Chloroflexota bacterium]
MAKTRKRRKSQPAGKRPLPKLMRDVSAAMELFENGDAVAARQQLIKLSLQYPRSIPVLFALLEVCQETEDWRTIASSAEQLLPLIRGEDRAGTLNNMMIAHVQLGYSALAWQSARDLITQYPRCAYAESSQAFVEMAEPLLWEEIEETMGDMPFSREEKFELRVLHDRVRFLTESGRSAEAIEAAERLLQKLPDMLPILNNLSLSQFMVGDVEAAIATAQQVVAQAPDNFHALGNLVRFYYLTARFDQAQVYAARLQHVNHDSPDLPPKQAEAFAFLGDDANVWAAYERAKARGVEMNPLLLHLAAAASYRLGEEKRAWQLWQQAAREFPNFEMAQDSLADRRLPEGARHVPWYWPFAYWFPQDFHQVLEKHLSNPQFHNEGGLEQA